MTTEHVPTIAERVDELLDGLPPITDEVRRDAVRLLTATTPQLRKPA